VKAGDFIYLDWNGDNFIFDIQRTELVKQGEAKNFTALDIKAFVEKFFANDKDAIMKKVLEMYPEYEAEMKKSESAPKAEEKKDPANPEEKAAEGDKKPEEKKAEEGKKDETKKPDDGTSNSPAPTANTNGMNGSAQAQTAQPAAAPANPTAPAVPPVTGSPTNTIPVAAA
jgi:hypothetical protein